MPCRDCKLMFHPPCLESCDPETRPETWICTICKLSLDASDDATRTSAFIKILKSNSGSPFAVPLATCIQAMRRQALEIRQLRSELTSQTPKSTSESFMDVADERRRILFIGNDLHLVKQAMAERLPKTCDLQITNFKSASMERIASEVKLAIANTEDDANLHVFIHPGVEECIRNEHRQLLAATQKLIEEMKTSSQGTRITLISVPQVVEETCLGVNNAFATLAEEEIVSYLPLTQTQADLMLSKEKRSYSQETARKISRILAGHFSTILGVKLSPESKSQDAMVGKNCQNKKEAGSLGVPKRSQKKKAPRSQQQTQELKSQQPKRKPRPSRPRLDTPLPPRLPYYPTEPMGFPTPTIYAQGQYPCNSYPQPTVYQYVAPALMGQMGQTRQPRKRLDPFGNSPAPKRNN